MRNPNITPSEASAMAGEDPIDSLVRDMTKIFPPLVAKSEVRRRIKEIELAAYNTGKCEGVFEESKRWSEEMVPLIKEAAEKRGYKKSQDDMVEAITQD